ncbi:MAG: choice-of-anchor D domain-containing protein [Candidatus Eisenbacteria bacterium]|nr:choice-of-anchor D domain-containing protein [Candidatus Eisenbacteria bacterium]
MSARRRFLRAVSTALCGFLLLSLACGKSSTVTPNPPMCLVTPASLDFPLVSLGHSAELEFTVANTGGGTLAGSVAPACGPFTLVGEDSFSLAQAQSRRFTVRFTPADTLVRACSLAVNLGTGSSGCSVSLSGRGTAMPVAQPACAVSPQRLDFGNVVLGDSSVLGFTVRNIGGGVLRGTATASCAGFTVVSGGSYALAAQESARVTVKFRPAGVGGPAGGTATAALGRFWDFLRGSPRKARPARATTGLQTCVIDLTDGGCGSVVATGTGVAAIHPVCQVAPVALDFGSVGVGQARCSDFVVTNIGGGTLTGSVRGSCALYRVLGDSTYSLITGEWKKFTVCYTPQAVGWTDTCRISAGGIDCGTVRCLGTGTSAPACRVTPSIVDFGTVKVGFSTDRIVTLKAGGTQPVTGSVSAACPEFSVIGGATYNLSPGDSAKFTVRFAPQAGGSRTCALSMGSGACGSVLMSGNGEIPPRPPGCAVSTTYMRFDTLLIGSSSEQELAITNTGDQVLTVRPMLGTYTRGFSMSPDSVLNIGGGASRKLIISFSPPDTGQFWTTVSLSATGCSAVTELLGYGRVAAPTLAPGYLSFGSQGNGDGQFQAPVAVAVDSEGSVFVLDSVLARVQKFTADGQFVGSFGSPGEGAGQFTRPFGLTVDSKDKIYVEDNGSVNGRVQVFGSDFTFGSAWTLNHGPGEGMTLGPLDRLYFLASTGVQVFTGSGAFVRTYGATTMCGWWIGSGVVCQSPDNNQLCCPAGMAVAPDGVAFIAEPYREQVNIYAQNGGTAGLIGAGQLRGPQTVALDALGNVYVGDGPDRKGYYSTSSFTISKYTRGGGLISRWGGRGQESGRFSWVPYLAISASGYVFATDLHNHRVQRFGPTQGSYGPQVVSEPGGNLRGFTRPGSQARGVTRSVAPPRIPAPRSILR